ncbi:hypothetical protein BC830DRAFT_1174122 [Chytriomyces sp. MP71]|nr:hypothetical protein BC830DRAFT_1174122 [Chytriomyces sp. MP71]
MSSVSGVNRGNQSQGLRQPTSPSASSTIPESSSTSAATVPPLLSPEISVWNASAGTDGGNGSVSTAAIVECAVAAVVVVAIAIAAFLWIKRRQRTANKTLLVQGNNNHRHNATGNLHASLFGLSSHAASDYTATQHGTIRSMSARPSSAAFPAHRHFVPQDTAFLVTNRSLSSTPSPSPPTSNIGAKITVVMQQQRLNSSPESSPTLQGSISEYSDAVFPPLSFSPRVTTSQGITANASPVSGQLPAAPSRLKYAVSSSTTESETSESSPARSNRSKSLGRVEERPTVGLGLPALDTKSYYAHQQWEAASRATALSASGRARTYHAVIGSSPTQAGFARSKTHAGTHLSTLPGGAVSPFVANGRSPNHSSERSPSAMSLGSARNRSLNPHRSKSMQSLTAMRRDQSLPYKAVFAEATHALSDGDEESEEDAGSELDDAASRFAERFVTRYTPVVETGEPAIEKYLRRRSMSGNAALATTGSELGSELDPDEETADNEFGEKLVRDNTRRNSFLADRRVGSGGSLSSQALSRGSFRSPAATSRPESPAESEIEAALHAAYWQQYVGVGYSWSHPDYARMWEEHSMRFPFGRQGYQEAWVKFLQDYPKALSYYPANAVLTADVGGVSSGEAGEAMSR